MKYIDLHCDALALEGSPCVNPESLKEGGCLLQVFAAFVSGEGLFSRALALFDKFDALPLNKVRRLSDLKRDVPNALLSVENGGALEGDIQNLDLFFRRGVRLMTLTWNHPNELGFPNFTGDPRRVECERGLTPFGESVVGRMLSLGMAVDVSHGSDKLLSDVYALCRREGKPFLASHSGAREVFFHARNLSDESIRLIAECGGVIGLDFYTDFLSPDKTCAGQREALLLHAEHILRVGGEDVLSLGSDFDGMPENPYIKNPACVGGFLEEFSKRFSPRIAEKIAAGNALRFFGDALK